MKDFLSNKKPVILMAIIVLLAGGGAAVYFYYGGFKKIPLAIFETTRVVVENPAPSAIKSASAAAGRFVVSTGEDIAIMGGAGVVIAGGKTLKESYALANAEAARWAEDAKLVYIKSLGTVTLSGASSGWETVFGSKARKKGYVLSVVSGNITDKKEIVSTSAGYVLPDDWYDGGEAIKSIQTLPQFRDATISGLSFYYNEDGQRWGYAIFSSNGTVSVPVR